MDNLDRALGVQPRAFSKVGTKFDQSTFYGRYRYFWDLIKVNSLFCSPGEVEKARRVIDTYDHLAPPNLSNEELWKAKWLVESTYRPGTAEQIPTIFRFSFFVPANVPIVIGMLLSPKTAFAIPFWQVVNQTFNVGFNYSNRPASAPFTNLQLAMAYLAATSASVAVAIGLNRVIVKRVGTSMILGTFGPATALAISGCLNLLIIRYKELVDGVQVYDEEGNVLGVSKMAARDGLAKTTLIRFAMQYPLCFPPVLMTLGLKGLGMLPRGRLGKVALDASIAAISLFTILPLCFAVYPQWLSADKLEEHLKTKGKFYYNRGL